MKWKKHLKNLVSYLIMKNNFIVMFIVVFIVAFIVVLKFPEVLRPYMGGLEVIKPKQK